MGEDADLVPPVCFLDGGPDLDGALVEVGCAGFASLIRHMSLSRTKFHYTAAPWAGRGGAWWPCVYQSRCLGGGDVRVSTCGDERDVVSPRRQLRMLRRETIINTNKATMHATLPRCPLSRDAHDW